MPVPCAARMDIFEEGLRDLGLPANLSLSDVGGRKRGPRLVHRTFWECFFWLQQCVWICSAYAFGKQFL